MKLHCRLELAVKQWGKRWVVDNSRQVALLPLVSHTDEQLDVDSNTAESATNRTKLAHVTVAQRRTSSLPTHYHAQQRFVVYTLRVDMQRRSSFLSFQPQ